MARIPPRTAPPTKDWLLRATSKLEKSIFRIVEHKYRNIILGLKAQIKVLEEFKVDAYDDIERIEKELSVEQEKVEKLEERLSKYEKPREDYGLGGEIIRFDQEVLEKNEKRKFDEIEVREEPIEKPSKILKLGSPPRPILSSPTLPPPGSPRTLGKKRERSSSSSSSDSNPLIGRRTQVKKIAQKGKTLIREPPPPIPEPSTLLINPPSVNKKKRNRKRKKKEKEI